MKKAYLSPAAKLVRLQLPKMICTSQGLGHSGPTATFMTSPGIGEDDDDEPAAGSRRRSRMVWDE